MKKKISVRDAVSLAIKTHGPKTPKELVKITGKVPSRVYTAISMLKKNGYLTRLDDGRYAITDVPTLTAMKPDVDPIVKKVQAVNTENRLAAARAEVDNLQHRLQELTIKYYDTLAVLKYLESKLTITKRN